MKDFKEKFVNFLYNFAFFWSIWYSFWVKVTNPSKGKAVLPTFKSTNEIIEALGFGEDYVKDPLNGALDIMYHPREIQDRINNDEKVGDCDDHAIYWAACLLKADIAKDAWIGTIYYKREDGSFGGHAVCVFEDYSGQLFWSDYRMPVAVASHEEWTHQIGNERYGVKAVASALVPVISLDKDDTPKFGRSFRVT